MKTLLIIGLMTLSSLAFAATRESTDRNNLQVKSCTSKTSGFFRNVQLDRGYYRGQNKYGKCFISFTSRSDNSGMILFINSKEAKYVASVEIGTSDYPNRTGISSEIKQCAVSKSSVLIQNKYRMPRTLYFGSDGSIGKSLSIFDIVENQTVELKKNSNGKLISASIKTRNGGLQNCYFQ